ncbi:centrosomal protein of 72 kDa-like isoform X23 [Elephas maximus indicus]|nr:centrosomal protein of 72 kDa-like isoform X23 [Elephas maximus indicus]XP_049715745.1 centrosomal protein of 72 kDa-like isoform X23 [Elephas maximus indicus]
MAPAGLQLVLCEERIREKSGLAAHRDLGELRSLSLPGTYQEKITHLGNSLMHLTGLKSLDLSRNSLVSLEGIQYLTALERLNLYYNCISSLAEVFRLRSLLELTDVDLRLNPVVKNESDYRLFVVHMLPNLRQLDDRPVRENERKASQLHFTSEESLASKHSFPAALKGGRPSHCRAKHADSLSKCLVLDADDEAVLNLIAECEWDLSNPPGSTGSSQRERETDFPSSQAQMRKAQRECGDAHRDRPCPLQRGLEGGGVGSVPRDHPCPLQRGLEGGGVGSAPQDRPCPLQRGLEGGGVGSAPQDCPYPLQRGLEGGGVGSVPRDHPCPLQRGLEGGGVGSAP